MKRSGTERLWVVIPAAGTGRRFGGDLPKQYRRLGDRSVLAWTVGAFDPLPGLQGIVLVIAEDDPHWSKQSFPGRERLRIAPGGVERAESVLNGLAALSADAGAEDFVLVHDAARPCLSPAALTALIDALAGHPVGGLLAVPVADTLKEANAAGEVVATRDRARLWQAQTPQMFRYGLLRSCLESALAGAGGGAGVTDESSAVEAAGYRPLLVPGEPQNLKITRAEDLALAARILGVTAGEND